MLRFRSFAAMEMVVVPRFPIELVEPGTFLLGKAVGQNTTLELSGGTSMNWVDVFTGKSQSGNVTLSVWQLLAQFPVASLLISP